MPAEEGFDAGGTGFYLLAILRQLPPLSELGCAALHDRRGRDPGGACGRGFLHPGRRKLATTRGGDAGDGFHCAGSPHYAWYFAWLIVFACFVRPGALLWLTNACLLLYLVPVGSHIVRDPHRLAVESIIYGPFAALALADLWYHRRRATRSR